MSLPIKTKSVAMTTLFGRCGGCGAKVDVLTRGDLPSCPNRTTASVRKLEGAAEVSRGHSRTADRSEGPNESRRGRPVGFVVVETQQLSLWDRLPGSESPRATVRQTTAAETEPDPAVTIVMEEVVRIENLEQALNTFFAERGLLTPSGYGPVCPVVWEGGGREAAPYPDHPGTKPAAAGGVEENQA